MFFDAKQGKCFGELGFMTEEERVHIEEQVAVRKHLSLGEAVRRFYANSRPGYHSNIREELGLNKELDDLMSQVTEEEIATFQFPPELLNFE